MKFILITNNPEVSCHFSPKETKHLVEVLYDETWTIMDVMIQVRDYTHRGHELLTHPLTGSIKPGETPYKSICISAASGLVDLNSVKIIEECIAVVDKMAPSFQRIRFNERIQKDFQLIDYHLITSGIESIQGGK